MPTLYAAIEGRPPFDAPALTAIIAAVLTRAPVSRRAWRLVPHVRPLAGARRTH